MKLRLHLAVLASALSAAWHRTRSPLNSQPSTLALANALPTRGQARGTALSDAAIGRRTVVTTGSDANHIAVCGVSGIPLGATEDASCAAAEARVAFAKFGLVSEELEGTASGAISDGDLLVPAASGALRVLPAAAGTYYLCGRARGAATDGGAVVFIPCFPIQRVVA